MDSTPSTRTAPYARPDQPHAPSRGGDVSLGTLAIAAAASAVAAFVTSQIWAGGTLVSAALSPVIVALVKEGLARPAEKVKTVRLVRGPRGEPVEAADDERPIPAGVAYEAEDLTPVTVYGRTERSRRPRFTRKQLRVAFITGLLAFGIVVVIYTVPELLGGSSIGGGGSSRTTLFGGTPAAQKKASKAKPSATATPTATPTAGATPTATPTVTVTATPTAAATATSTPVAPTTNAAPTVTAPPAATP